MKKISLLLILTVSSFILLIPEKRLMGQSVDSVLNKAEQCKIKNLTKRFAIRHQPFDFIRCGSGRYLVAKKL